MERQIRKRKKKADGGQEEKEGDRKADIGHYGALPSSHLSQLAVNECSVNFCIQFYGIKQLLHGLLLTVFTPLTAAAAQLLLMPI